MLITLEQKEEVQRQLEEWIETDPRRLAILAELIVALPLSRSVQSGDVASNIVRDVQDESIKQMLRRFYMNEAITWEAFYWPLVERVVKSLHVPAYYLLIDTTDVGNEHRTVVLSLAYQNRSLPLIWVTEKGKKGHTSEAVQVALLHKLSTQFKPTRPVIFLGDSEFDGVPLQDKLNELDWFYVLRTSPNFYIYPPHAPDGIRLGDLVPAVDSPEQTLRQVRFTDKHRFGPLDCFACWESPHTEPLILIFHLPQQWGYSARTTYKTRFWTEPLFRDFKEGGFRLSTSRLDDSDRIDTLFLALSASYLWMVSLGAALIATGHSSLVDHSSHRTLSIFKTGWRWFKRELKLGNLFLFQLILPKHIVLPRLFFKHTCVG
jgi:hypothetical protein